MRKSCLALLLALPLAAANKSLDIYFIDVEGGQATLIVTPSKQAMLVDTGWPGYEGRDAKRIREAAKKAGVKHIDYLVTTHFHRDHIGGVSQLLQLLPVKTFVDHGDNTETDRPAKELSEAYAKALTTGQRLTVKPGDRIPLKGVDVEIVSANGNTIKTARKGAGGANPACASESDKAADATENGRSTGMFLTFGKFRFVDLGDLTWNVERQLSCPANLLGEADVYLTTHHGTDPSGPASIVNGLHPRVAIMNNGAKKGGQPSAWKIVKASPGLEDLWQLHFALAGGKETNVPDPFIANPDEACQGNWIRVSAMADGSFTVYNSRNKYSKSYPAK